MLLFIHYIFLINLGLCIYDNIYNMRIQIYFFTTDTKRDDAAPTGLRPVRLRFSTEISSLRDSRNFEVFKVSA